jgi:hypothetical protein
MRLPQRWLAWCVSRGAHSILGFSWLLLPILFAAEFVAPAHLAKECPPLVDRQGVPHGLHAFVVRRVGQKKGSYIHRGKDNVLANALFHDVPPLAFAPFIPAPGRCLPP